MAHGFALLTPGNPKTIKGMRRGFMTYILHLAPHTLSGYNVCPMAGECKFPCLNSAGRGGMAKGEGRLTYEQIKDGIRTNAIQACRIRRTKMFFERRSMFMELLVRDIKKAIKKAKKQRLTPVFRLNGTSDIRWERVPVTVDGKTYPNIFAAFPRVQFYDYTKIPNRKDLPANYALTFSLDERNEVFARAVLARGGNVAAVFRDKARVERAIGEGYLGFPVFNGDDSDLRFLDPRGNVIALYAKGNAKRDMSGFVKD